MESTAKVFVLDAFAMVAYFKQEPAGPRVRELLESGQRGESVLLMSVVNWGEVLYSSREWRAATDVVNTAAILDSLPIAFRDVDRDLAFRAAQYKTRGRISFADCFAAALAYQAGATVLTGDPEFQRVEDEVRIEWLPQRARG